jgi:hypothetical protein
MITENKNRDKNRPFGGLDNSVQQNKSLNQDYQDREPNGNSEKEIGNPVHNGGVETSNFDLELEEQWLGVRDEYLAHYADVEEVDTNYENGSFYIIIDKLAKRRKRTTKEIHNEIMEWSLNK